jgi:hypothetical protein
LFIEQEAFVTKTLMNDIREASFPTNLTMPRPGKVGLVGMMGFISFSI